MNTKRCYMCKEVKDLNDFHSDRNRPGGRANRCKMCSKDFWKGRNRSALKNKAHDSIQNAIRRRAIPPVSDQECVVCGRQAEEYHHWSYDERYREDVIPLCCQCHSRLHAGVFMLNLEVVKHVYPVVVGGVSPTPPLE